MGINERFRTQREQLGLSQKAAADLLGASLNTVSNWERGVGSPSAEALAKLGAAGADMLYILTGERTPPATLSPEEVSLLSNYNDTHPQGRDAVMAVLQALRSAGQQSQPRQVFQAAVGQVIENNNSQARATVKSK